MNMNAMNSKWALKETLNYVPICHLLALYGPSVHCPLSAQLPFVAILMLLTIDLMGRGGL